MLNYHKSYGNVVIFHVKESFHAHEINYLLHVWSELSLVVICELIKYSQSIGKIDWDPNNVEGCCPLIKI